MSQHCWSCEKAIPPRRVRERALEGLPPFLRKTLHGAQNRMGYGTCPSCRQRFYVFYNREGHPWVQPDMIPQVEDAFPPRTRTSAEMRKRAWMRYREEEMRDFFSPGRGRKGRGRRPVAPRRRKVDPYRVLGIPKGAPRRDVDRAFRERAKRCHPDRVAQLDSEFQELAHRKFLELKMAYDAVKEEISERRQGDRRGDGRGRRR